MTRAKWRFASLALGVLAAAALLLSAIHAQQPDRKTNGDQPPKRGASSYSPVVMTESFQVVHDRMAKAKPEIMQRQMALLADRYDLSDRPARDVRHSDRDKPIQEGVRVKLPKGVSSWDQLAGMTPEEIR